MVALNQQPMAACPNCRQPVPFQPQQVFDVSLNPAIKDYFLSGQANLLQCPSCGFAGTIGTPIIYHDPEKELFLTHVPVELNLPREEKERVLGALTQAIMRNIPQEGMKAYLFQPTEMLTMKSMIEKVLGADGITPEMIASQQAKMNLVGQLLQAEEDTLDFLIQDNQKLIDEEFFGLFSQLIQNIAMSGDEEIMTRIGVLNDKLIAQTDAGRKIGDQQATLEKAAADLEQHGEKLDRKKFLKLLVNSESDDYTSALISLARPLADYEMFMLLTERIQAASGEKKAKLEHIRDMVMTITQEMDAAAQARGEAMVSLLQMLLQADDLEAAITQNLQYFNDDFMAVLGQNLAAANENGQTELAEKLRTVGETLMRVVQQGMPPEIQFVNELLSQESPEEAQGIIRRRISEFPAEMPQIMDQIADSLDAQGQSEQAAKLRDYKEFAEKEIMMAKWR